MKDYIFYNEGKKANQVSAGEQTEAVKQENHFYRQNHDSICRFHRARNRILTRVKTYKTHAQLELYQRYLSYKKNRPIARERANSPF